MPVEKYRDMKFKPHSVQLIKKTNQIIAEYDAMGYQLTLRQVYYQMVARDILPNNFRSYKNLGTLISNARLAGLIDWNAIDDITRNLRRNASWDSPADIMQSTLYSYRRDRRATQPEYIEVWVEKDALIGVIEKVASRNDVPCFSCRGYTSQSEMWRAAKRLMRRSDGGTKPVTIIHLGDHDPSGIDMTRDIQARLSEFGAEDFGIFVDRIALNWNQIEEYNPPANPAKETDIRYKGYKDMYGEDSWELDALNPRVLDRLVQEAIDKHTDQGLMDIEAKREAGEKKLLSKAIEFVASPSNWISSRQLTLIGHLKLVDRNGNTDDMHPEVELSEEAIEDNVAEPDGKQVFVIQQHEDNEEDSDDENMPDEDDEE